MAEMATLVLPMLFPRAQIVAERSLLAGRGSILLRLESLCQEGCATDFQARGVLKQSDDGAAEAAQMSRSPVLPARRRE